MLPQVFPILPGCFDSEYWTVADVPFEYDDITIFSEWDSAATAYVERGIAEVKGKKYPFALRRGE